MFRITEDPSSESLVQCLDKNYKNDSVGFLKGTLAIQCSFVCLFVAWSVGLFVG